MPMKDIPVNLHVRLDWSRVEPARQAYREAVDLAIRGRDIGGPPEVTAIFLEIGEQLKVIGAEMVEALKVEQDHEPQVHEPDGGPMP